MGHLLIDKISTLDMINYEIAELQNKKELLEREIAAEFEHKDEGQVSHKFGRFNITIKTGYNYSLEKGEYEIYSKLIPQEFNPVKVVTKYEIDKKLMREVEKYASKDDLEKLSHFITKKPAKLYMTIKAAV